MKLRPNGRPITGKTGSNAATQMGDVSPVDMKALQTKPAPTVTGKRRITRTTLNSTTQHRATHWGE